MKSVASNLQLLCTGMLGDGLNSQKAPVQKKVSARTGSSNGFTEAIELLLDAFL